MINDRVVNNFISLIVVLPLQISIHVIIPNIIQKLNPANVKIKYGSNDCPGADASQIGTKYYFFYLLVGLGLI